MSILITKGKIPIGHKLIQKNILIEKGKIKEITSKIPLADEIIQADGLIILPGLIDPHVHLREPGQEYKEDFKTGSMAAAKGGFTTILDMPNNKPPILTNLDLKNKRTLAKKSIVNYGLFFATNGKNLSEIKKAKNIASLKLYMDLTTGNLIVNNTKLLENIFKNLKFITVHAEGEMVEKAISLAKKYKNKLYLCHISSKKEIDFIRKNKTKNIFVEVAPHHLFLTQADKINASEKGFYSMKPALKLKTDQDALWAAIKDDIVDTIGSDHAPHTIQEKESYNPPFGVPGLETTLPLLLDAVNKKIITLEKLVILCSRNPAKIFNIKNKGELKKGFDADLTIIDLELEKQVRNEELLTKCKWSPYSGMKLKGWPVMTIVNGEIAFENDKIVFENGEITNYGKIASKEIRFNSK